MARDKNTYAKRQRESQKRQKAEAKQERRRVRKEQPEGTDAGALPSDGNPSYGDLPDGNAAVI
jgi:hypothetical protein